MKKVLLFLFALLGLGASGVWADVTVTFVDGTNAPYDTYGTRNTGVSPNTLTTNANSGCAGVVLSAPVIDRATWWSTYCLALKPNATQTDETVSITAPAGYLITSLSMTLRANSSSFPYDVVFDGNTTTVTGAKDFAFSKDGIKVKSFAFTINHTAENFDGTNKWLAVKAMTVTLAPINFVSLTFDRSSNGVTVNVKDADGDAIPGVTASLESTSFTAFMTGSAAALSRETNSVLAPAQNSGYANSQDASITYTFKVEGLSGFTYSKAALDVYAMTGGGEAQNNGGDTQREWTFDIAIGTAADATTSFVNQTGNDICTVSDTDGGLHHKLWTMTGSDGTATDALYIVVTLTKTASLGCFAGIGELQLFKPGATVQYVISDASGPIYTSDPVVAIPGETINTLPSALQREFCEYEVTPAVIGAGENTVNVTVTYNTPFEISPSYDNAKWYYLKLKDATFVTYSSSGTPNVTLPNSYTMGDANAQWAFIGDAYNGFSIVNKAGGNALVLGSASPKSDGNTGANTYATLGSGQEYEKYFPKSSNHVSNGFYLFTSEGYAMNQRSTSNLAYWTGGYDKGSTFSVVEVVDDYAEDVANVIKPWFTSYGNYFQLKAPVVEANQAKYEAALVECNLATFNELKALIDDAANYVYPATGNYRIKSSGSRIGESYIGYGQPSSASAGLITVKAENAITDASTIITLTGADGAYTISTQGKYAKNQTSNNVAFPMTDNAEEAATFYFIPYTPGVVVITNDRDTYGYFHEAGWAIPGVVRWTAASTASHWTIEDLPDVTVKVTFNLVVGNNVVNTITQEGVAGNTTISVPSSLTANYSSLGYDFTGNEDVNVGEEELVVNVIATLKNGVVADLANLSNGKSYTLTTERGALYIKSDHLASNHNDNAGAEAGTFALLKYEDNYYLYSVDASKFVLGDGSLSETPTSEIAVLTLTAQSLNPLFLGILGNKGLNVTNTTDNYELVINSWVTADAGNQYCIIEAADFDATEALAALEEYFHPAAEAQFAQAIEALEAINFGTGLNQYGFTGQYAGYTSQAETVISGLKQQGYSDENLQFAQALLSNYAINVPSAGFYRIKGKTSGKYLAAGKASNGKFAMSNATDASTIFYFDGTKLTNFGSGMCNGMNKDAWAWVKGDAASIVSFQDGLTNGGYGIKSSQANDANSANFYDNGDGTNSADRGGNVVINGSTNTRYCKWYLETVTELPIALNDGGDGSYYATLCLPYAVDIEGATAYTLTKDGVALNLSSGETAIAGGTPVLVIGSGESATATITPSNTPAEVATGGTLVGTYLPIAFNGDKDYVLGKSEDKVGFFHWEGETLKGFRAYIAGEAAVVAGGQVKGFYLNNDIATQIREMVGASDSKAAYYDLSGRRVAQPTRGLYIVNGKKVAVK